MKKEYSLPLMNDHYRTLLDLVIRDNGNMDYLGAGQISRVRPTYNRLRKSPVWRKIAERGNTWELAEFAQHITQGEFLANAETFLWYLLDRYADREQMTLTQAAADEESIRWHFEDLACMLRGLSIRYPDLISFWYTHGQTCITFNTNKN